MFVKVSNGAVEKFPYTTWDLRRDNPRVSFPAPMPVEILADYGMHDVAHEADPPHDPKTHRVETSNTPVYKNGSWVLPKSVVPRGSDEILAEAEAQRLSAYRAESDPLFFKWQRGSATKEEWLEAVANIKARYPDPI